MLVRIRILIALVLSLLASNAVAGPNVGGVILLHYNPTISASCDAPGSFCGQSDLASCESAITRHDTGGGAPECPVLFVMAAFPSNGQPRLTGAVFGIDYDASEIEIEQWRTCTPFELPTFDWPAPGSGVAVTFLDTQQAHLVELYQLIAVNPTGVPSTLRLKTHPTQGGWFADDSIPAELDLITAFGSMGFDTDGSLSCPPPLPARGACCFPDGHCEQRFPGECIGSGQTFQGENTPCSPNPCSPVPSACCLEDGTCVLLLPGPCASEGGIFHGYGVPCAPGTCPPAAACCFASGQCQLLTQAGCVANGGIFHPNSPDCDPNPCPQPTACCYPDGHCVVQQVSVCNGAGGTPLGGGVPCDPNPCFDLPGACCVPEVGCQSLQHDACLAQNGVWYGYGVECADTPCPQPGACCFLDGTCVFEYLPSCAEDGGQFQGINTDCQPNPCPQPGACCLADGTCAFVPEWKCAEDQGTFGGNGSSCDPNPCPQPCGTRATIHRENAPAPLPTLTSWPGRESIRTDGPNHNGTLVLHTNPAITYSSDNDGYCGQSNVTSCGSVISRVDGSSPAVIYALAAFPLHSHPRLAGITFGLTYGACVVLDSWGACADFELATGAWPEPGEGTALTWNAARTTLMTEVYWFAAYAYDGRIDQMSVTPHPTQGGQFADDSIPSLLDPIAAYGSLGFNRAGSAPCPPPAPAVGGCCLLTGECIVTGALSCVNQGGTYFGDDTLCDAQPCVPRGACCVNGACFYRTGPECQSDGGTYFGDGAHCTPALCGPDTGCASGIASGTSHGEAKNLGIGQGILINPDGGTGTGCGTLYMNGDQSYENGYAWSYSGVVAPTYGAFAECFAASGGGEAVCSAIFDLTQVGAQAGQPMDIYVWADGGGCPGNVICGPMRVTPGPIAFWPSVSRHVFDFSGCCVESNFWVGFWGRWPGLPAGWYVAADLNGLAGCPSTNIAPGIGFSTGWNNVDVVWGPTQALGIGCELTSCGAIPTKKLSWGKVKALYQGDSSRGKAPTGGGE